MIVRLLRYRSALLLLGGFLLTHSVCHSACLGNELEQDEVYFFYDDTQSVDEQSASAIRVASESGLRIREIAANRFPNLAKRFQVRRLPSLVLLRRNRLEGRHEGRFTFKRIRQMLAKARENRLARRERIREMLAGSGRVRRDDAPSSAPPLAPRYVPTSSNTVETNFESGRVIPKPLDRNGRFAVAHNATSAEQKAFDATVRIRVIDPSGTSHGTGTIIHVSGRDALVLTCGHIFRESRGRGRIEGDVCFSTEMKTVNGKLISYDSNAHDIALLTIRTPIEMTPAKIARSSFRGRLNDDVFTIGCDKGNRPTIRRSHFKRAASYDGTEKYDVFGRPIDGRSGGGLFNQKGELIGVCNAAAVHIDEGIYSGLKTIYRQLGLSHLAHLFKESYWSENSRVATRSNSSQTQVSSASQSNSSVQFQALPQNPSLAFRSSGPTKSLNRPSGATGMVPVGRKSFAQQSADYLTESPAGRGRAASSMANTTINRPPRIPSFQMSDQFE